MAFVAVAGLFLAGCGSLGSYEVAPVEFIVHGDGAYADAALVQKEAQKACPSGFTKKSEEMTRGTADFRGPALAYRLQPKIIHAAFEHTTRMIRRVYASEPRSGRD